MTTTALVKEGCGTHYVYDQTELERHLKLGWAKRPDDWKEKKYAAEKARKAEALKAQMAQLQAEQAELDKPKKGK